MLVASSVGVLTAAPAWADEPAAKTDHDEVGTAKGRLEFSTGASLTSFKEGSEDESFTIVNVPLRAGGFVTDRLELEGELIATYFKSGFGDSSDSQTGARFSANALYHFRARSRTTPFLLVGAGIGNSVDYFDLAVDAERTVKTIHGGAGLKMFFGRRASLRLEYRYTHFSGEEVNAFSGSSVRDSVSSSSHRVFFGISLWSK